MSALAQHPAVAGAGLRVELRNCGPADGGLNHLVGADFVQKERRAHGGWLNASR